MKLLKRLLRIERRVSGDELERAIAAGAGLGIVWTRDESGSQGLELGPGERYVEDLMLDDSAGPRSVDRGRTMRRVTADPGDHGVVYDARVRRIGRVVAVKGGGSLIEWE